jgi:hypothetical protein
MKWNTHPREAAHIAARIKAWAQQRFGTGEEAWLVTEAACVVPGSPPLQTTLVLLHPAARIAFRIPRPMADITPGDIAALGETAAALAAEACC